MRHNRHQLLRQHIQRIARKARRLDVPLVHGARHRGAGHQVGAVLGKENPLAHRIHVMAGAADALHPAGHRGRRFNLNHQVHGAHVDAQLQRRSGAQRTNLPRLQLLLDDRALRRGQRAVMRAGDRLSGQFVQRARQPLGHLAAVDKENRRVALANDLQQPGMNRIPDGDAPRRLRGRPAGQLLLLAQPRHILHRNLNAQLQLLGCAGVHNRHRTVAQLAAPVDYGQKLRPPALALSSGEPVFNAPDLPAGAPAPRRPETAPPPPVAAA